VTGNLFGFVNDTVPLEKAAREKTAFLVDDAAQAFGAARERRFAGTAGDVGFYSLAGGKALGSVQGGLIVTNSDATAGAIRHELEQLGALRAFDSVRLFVKTAAYAGFCHPRLFWIPWRLPFLKLGKTEFDPDFPVTQFPALTGRLLTGLAEMIGGTNGTRRGNAAAIAEKLAGNPRFALPRPVGDCRPSYIRLPVLATDARTRQRAVDRLQLAGIGASPFYPTAICDIPGIERHMAATEFHCPRAEELARRLFTLPTHAYVGPREIEHMSSVLNELEE
jgi:dTDP-4-amino-4,6-dideoxygalactose transaminase